MIEDALTKKVTIWGFLDTYTNDQIKSWHSPHNLIVCTRIRLGRLNPQYQDLPIK